jgi:hypothetical protein
MSTILDAFFYRGEKSAHVLKKLGEWIKSLDK